jgi:two-component system, sensor histidine kinase YesM
MESGKVKTILIIGIIVSLCVRTSISYLLFSSILGPLRQLTIQMGKLKENNYKVNLSLQSNDEIGRLYSSFKEMSAKLDELINEVFVEKLNLKEAEMKALQAQISPHFLYNNLNTAYSMSQVEKAKKTGKIVIALSKLYRMVLQTSIQSIKVKDEIEYANIYLVIQRIRYEECIQFSFDVSEGTENMSTTCFIIQPLIENAINHGILPSGRNGQIQIRIYIENEDLIFTIKDNGVGGDIDEINSLINSTESTDSRGFAIRNINQRIQLRFGSQYGITFSNNGNSGGMIVTVRQPAVL